MEWLKCLIEFIILFVLTYLYYRFIAIKELRPRRKNKKEKIEKESVNKKKSNKKIKILANNAKDFPEIRLLVLSYKLDEDKIDYIKLAKLMSLVLSFNLSLTVVLTLELFDSLFLKILIGIVTLLFTMLTSYRLIGTYYQKKGMKKNV